MGRLRRRTAGAVVAAVTAATWLVVVPASAAGAVVTFPGLTRINATTTDYVVTLDDPGGDGTLVAWWEGTDSSTVEMVLPHQGQVALPLDDTITENAQVEVWVGRCPGATLVEECEVLAHAGARCSSARGPRWHPSSSARSRVPRAGATCPSGPAPLAGVFLPRTGRSSWRGPPLPAARPPPCSACHRARRLSWECWSSPTWSTRTSGRSAARSRSRPVSTAPRLRCPRWRCPTPSSSPTRTPTATP